MITRERPKMTFPGIPFTATDYVADPQRMIAKIVGPS